jgi:hypothetical protein
LIHFELIFVHSERHGSSFSSSFGYQVFQASFVEEVVFSPVCVLGFFVEDQLAINV